MTQIYKEINQQLEATGKVDVLALYQTLHPVSSNDLLETLLEVINQQQPELKKTCFLTQAETVLEQLSHTTDDDQILSALCNKLSVMQTVNSISRYIHASDCHQHFGNKADVVMFGDSITEWGVWHEMFPDVKLTNRGIAGDTTKGMLRRIETTLQLKPSKVFVMAGINDLAQGYSVDEVFSRYLKMLDFWQQHNIEPVVQSTLYVGSRLASLNPLVTELNTMLAQACQSHGIRFVDLTTVLCPSQKLPQIHSCDDLHLNAVAYQKWQDIIVPLLT